MMFRLYDGLAFLVVWLILVPWELARAMRSRSSPTILWQRLGWPLGAPCGQPGTRVIFHAVSAGEVRAAEPILDALVRRLPDIDIIGSTGCADGMAAWKQVGSRVPQLTSTLLLPWDRKAAVRRWLRGLAPDAVVVVETEIWPNLFQCSREMGIPLNLVGARIYENDLARYRLLPSFFGRVLAAAEWIGVQSEVEAERFRRIGAPPERVEVVGNPKWDVSACTRALAPAIARELAEQDLILIGGSTHPPEEEWLLDAFKVLKGDWPQLRLVLAPRRVSRSSRMAGEVSKQGFRSVRLSAFSAGARPAQWDVLIVDEIGWLPSLYAAADLAFVGGSLVPHGGHNPVEAAAAGCPVVTGPHTGNFPDVIEALVGSSGIVRLVDHRELTLTLKRMLEDAAWRVRLAAAARAVVRHHRGCTDRYACRIQESVGATARARTAFEPPNPKELTSARRTA